MLVNFSNESYRSAAFQALDNLRTRAKEQYVEMAQMSRRTGGGPLPSPSRLGQSPVYTKACTVPLDLALVMREARVPHPLLVRNICSKETMRVVTSPRNQLKVREINSCQGNGERE